MRPLAHATVIRVCKYHAAGYRVSDIARALGRIREADRIHQTYYAIRRLAVAHWEDLHGTRDVEEAVEMEYLEAGESVGL